MTIENAILQLEEAKQAGVRNVILAWWEAGAFPLPDNQPRKDDEDWAAVCDIIEHEMDWANAHESMATIIDQSSPNPPTGRTVTTAT